jgi:hypothetical protein
MDDGVIREEMRRWLQHLEDQWLAEDREAPAQTAPIESPDPAVRSHILNALRESLAHAAGPAEDRAVVDQNETELLRTENARLRAQLELNRTAYDYLVRLAHHFSGEEPSLESPDQIRAFCERIKRSAGLLVREFQELLSGRKKIQMNWSLYTSSAADPTGEMTRQIRLGDIHGDLGRLLFDWKTTTLDEASTAGLKSAIDELKHHQLAIMAGYERCVREGTVAVLQTLDPLSLEQEFLGVDPADETRRPIWWRRLLPGRGLFLWRRYRARYDRLVAEDDRWFQARFLPAFRQGYRDYMWTKTQAASQRRETT